MRELILSLDHAGAHGVNEELARHSDTDGRVERILCGAECESVVHVLWKCSTCRIIFRKLYNMTLWNLKGLAL